MPVDAWPASLPQKLQREDWGRTLPDGRLRSKNDKGPAKVRLRSSAAAAPMKGSIIVRTEQKEEFEEFVVETLLGGALPFSFPSQEGGLELLVRIGEEMPTVANLGAGWWQISLSLEVLP